MPDLGIMNGETLDRFNAICERITARGSGILATEIDDAGALARELAELHPDEARVEDLRRRLGLEGWCPND